MAEFCPEAALVAFVSKLDVAPLPEAPVWDEPALPWLDWVDDVEVDGVEGVEGVDGALDWLL